MAHGRRSAISADEILAVREALAAWSGPVTDLLGQILPAPTSCGRPGNVLCGCDRCRAWVRAHPQAQEVQDHRRLIEAWMKAHPGRHPETGHLLTVTTEAYLMEVFGC